MDKLRALHYFTAAAEAGSFAGAARRFGVSVPAVQKLVGALERGLGVVLFARSTRGLELTASGHSYLESCRPLLAELEAIDDAVTRSARRPAGTLVVGAHSQLAHHLLLPALPAFHAAYPDILVDVRVLHRMSDPDAESVDVFLLHGWPEAGDLVHLRLGHALAHVMASPEYWRRHGIPQHPRDLERHNCILLRNPAGLLLDLWEFEGPQETVTLTARGWMQTNSRELLLDAVLAGEGVGRMTSLTTRTHVTAGRLVPVLPDWEVRGGPPVNVLYAARNRRMPRARAFIDFVSTVLTELADAGLTSAHKVGVELPHWHRRGFSRASAAVAARR